MVTNSNGRAEIRLVDDVRPYVQSWNRKSLANYIADALSCSIPCMSKNTSYALHVHENINETKVKLPLENIRLLTRENSLKDESMETEFNDISNLVHTPSYYMAVNASDAESHRSSKVIMLPRGNTDNFLCDSLDTETSSPESTKSQVKRSQSDSAISIPTSNSLGACSRANSPSVKKFKILKKRVAKCSEKSAKHSSTQTSTQSSVEEIVELGTKPTTLTYQDSSETQAFPSSNGFPVEGSMSNFMDDYFEKMNSMSKSNENLKESGDLLQREEVNIVNVSPDLHSLSSEGSSIPGGEVSDVLLGNSRDQAELQQLLPTTDNYDSTDSNRGFCVFVPNSLSKDSEASKILEKRHELKRNDTTRRRERLTRQKKIDQEKDPSESDHSSHMTPDQSVDWSHDTNSQKCNSHSSVGSDHGNDRSSRTVQCRSKESKNPLQTSSPRQVKSQNSSHQVTPV